MIDGSCPMIWNLGKEGSRGNRMNKSHYMNQLILISKKHIK